MPDQAVAEAWAADTLPCTDPECGGLAEPEADGSLRYWACTDCGREFGYEQAPSGDCQLGVPEDVRRRASPVPVAAPVFLGSIGRRPA